MGSVKRQENGTYRARYRDTDGKEHLRRFKRSAEARSWLADQEAAVRRGDHIDARTARLTVGEWLDRWLEGYGSRRASTVRQANVHARIIRQEFGDRRLGDIRPSEVKAWVARLGEKYADSTRYAIYRRFSQVMSDAVHDGLIPRSPCSRKTSPRQGSQRPEVATVEQVWELHDAMPDHLRPAVLLGAFAGLRVSEVCGLRVTDVDLMRGIVSPAQQWGGEPLKSDAARTPVPIPSDLSLMLAAQATGETFVLDELGKPLGPWAVERAVRYRRGTVQGLPQGFRFHDLRHTYASLLISQGLDVKTRCRRACATHRR
ncbi:site-specific integrase [Terrabacter ginsenosidimutans]|uniref:Site-specific integrase n=1 Tax=Terrabacter ginsenosidimutans TaxID=490575 RepID=A0ABP7DF56_9MICO